LPPKPISKVLAEQGLAGRGKTSVNVVRSVLALPMTAMRGVRDMRSSDWRCRAQASAAATNSLNNPDAPMRKFAAEALPGQISARRK
jgi:hypothetical protein